MTKLTIKGFERASKKMYELANSSNVKRVYEALDKIVEKFPEITKNNNGYVCLTIGEFLERNNAKEWMIETLKKTGEYNKKGMFGIICAQTGKNSFTNEPILTEPKLSYLI